VIGLSLIKSLRLDFVNWLAKTGHGARTSLFARAAIEPEAPPGPNEIDVDRGSVQSLLGLDTETPAADHLNGGSSAPATTHPQSLDVRVLVAEDHPVNQELLRIILQSVGVQVHVVGDGAQAVDAYRSGGFDIILMDVQMPVMDGPEAARRIRALETEGARVPIIALTANVMPHQVNAYLAAGMDAHLGKPIDFNALVETMFDWVERSRGQTVSDSAKAA